MEIIEGKHNISKQQPISNKAEELFSNKTQKTIILIISKRKTK